MNSNPFADSFIDAPDEHSPCFNPFDVDSPHPRAEAPPAAAVALPAAINAPAAPACCASNPFGDKCTSSTPMESLQRDEDDDAVVSAMMATSCNLNGHSATPAPKEAAGEPRGGDPDGGQLEESPRQALSLEEELQRLIVVDPPSFSADMKAGLERLLSSARHSDLCFEAADVHVRAHQVVLEARCGEAFLQAVEGLLLGPVSQEDGTLHVQMPRVRSAELIALLRYVYSDRFESPSDPRALLELCNAFDVDDSIAPVRQLRQLCERELARAVDLTNVVARAHEGSRLRARQLARYCVTFMSRHFEQLQSSGSLQQLQTELSAQLFLLRSAAPLQDALQHARVDALEWLLSQPDVDAEKLLHARDIRGRTVLELALGVNDLGTAKLLLQCGAPAGASASTGDESLLHVMCAQQLERGKPIDAAQGDGADGDMALRQAELLLENGAPVNFANGRGESPLDVAMFAGSLPFVQLLLRHGAVSTMLTREGGGLLHAAAAALRPDVIELALPWLSKVGLDLNGVDELGQTALHLAVGGGDSSVVTPLLRARALTGVRTSYGATALELAVQESDLSITAMLLQAAKPVGANKDETTADGLPILLLAAERSVPITLALVQASAQLNAADKAGRTALEVAVGKGEVELCEVLLSRGAVPTLRKDVAGNSLLHSAVMLRSERLVKMLVRHKAELSDQNRRGSTPLLLAAETGQTDVAALLLQAGAGLHLCDSTNRSALEAALENGHLETLRVLLSQPNVDVNGITRRGSSLLHLAAETGDEDKVKFLLSQQALVDVLNPNAETPLHWACSLGHMNVVRCLIQHGADAMLQERVGGLTPLHAACGARGQPAVLALLIQRCERMHWNSNPQKCNIVDLQRNTPLHTCAKQAPQPIKSFPILLEHDANPSLPNAQGQTVLHLIAERAVLDYQERHGVGEGAAVAGNEGSGEAQDSSYIRLIDMLTEFNPSLDAQETETGNTALHIAAFGGCIDLALQLACMGASVALPNKDGFAPLDSMQPSHQTRSLPELLLSKISKPPSWVPDRMVSACQQCKLPFDPRRGPNLARKHHCRHCGRCVCFQCSPHRVVIPKFGSSQEERVCLLCERVLTSPS